MKAWVPRRHPAGPRPCLGMEALGQVLADDKSAHLLVTGPASGLPDEPESLPNSVEAGVFGALTRGERLAAHAIVFAVGVWNLLLIDLARTPDTWWFWIPAIVWAAVLALHGVWFAVGGGWLVRRPPGRQTRRPVAVNRGEGGP